MKHIALSLGLLLLVSCHNKTEGLVSTIDSTLQTNVLAILENGLEEYGA